MGISIGIRSGITKSTEHPSRVLLVVQGTVLDQGVLKAPSRDFESDPKVQPKALQGDIGEE